MLYNNPKPQDTKEGLSDQDFSIYMDAHTVPFSKYPSYMPAGVLGICTEGNAEIQVGLRKYVICANDILIFMPGFLVSFIKSSPTFTIDYCTFSNVLFYDVINGSIKRFPTGFHTYTQTHCVYSLSQEKAEQFSIYFRLLYNRATSPTYLFTKESITNLLKLPFLELYADYYSTVKEHKVTTLHKEEIGYFFLDLLLKHYKENKEVAFYAEKLHVSSKYLTEALTLVSGKSPKEWIIHYTLHAATGRDAGRPGRHPARRRKRPHHARDRSSPCRSRRRNFAPVPGTLREKPRPHRLAAHRRDGHRPARRADARRQRILPAPRL